MAALLVVSLCVPHVFGDRALLFASAITVARALHIGLFILGSHDDPELRASVIGLAGSTALGCGLMLAGSFAGSWQAWVWLLALVLDMAGPKFFGVEGWRLVPGHYAERFGLIVLIALGESIVAIGAGSGADVDAGIVVSAILGVIVSAGLFWLYFDVVSLVAERRLSNATPGREQNAHRARLVHLPAPADGRRHRARGARLQEDARRRPRAPARRARNGTARRHRALPARARGLPLAQRAPAVVRRGSGRRALRRADRARACTCRRSRRSRCSPRC